MVTNNTKWLVVGDIFDVSGDGNGVLSDFSQEELAFKNSNEGVFFCSSQNKWSA